MVIKSKVIKRRISLKLGLYLMTYGNTCQDLINIPINIIKKNRNYCL